jgi:hypothetical protein
MEGKSLSDYLLSEIREIAEQPSIAELRDRIRRREPVSVGVSIADLIREEREAR